MPQIIPNINKDSLKIRLGLLGECISLSRTPAMHMQEGKEHGLNIRYDLIDTQGKLITKDGLAQLIDDLIAQGYTGINVTHPFKQAIIPHLSGISDDAQALGAVNTVIFNNRNCLGYNTDWTGFSESFIRTFSDVNKDRILVLGAGGAGSAVAYALLKNGVKKLILCDVDSSKLKALLSRLKLLFPNAQLEETPSADAVLKQVDGLVNTTPVGMDKYPGVPLDVSLLRKDLWVTDVIYFPLETELIKQAKAGGCKTMSGNLMAVFQAVKAFELFTGKVPNAERMMAHFNSMNCKNL
jgi:shikimate dehydrogenase